jgi:ketohexokinase
MARILGTGNATVDIVHSLKAYPAENDEVRCDSRVVCRGGNAANTLVVLSQLGHRCSWAGVLTDDADGRFVRDDLTGTGVDTVHCRTLSRGAMPVSTVILDTTSGSRTIIHYRDLPEYRAADFHAIPLQEFDWLHFEGRNPHALATMLGWARLHHPAIPVSLEIEKPRDGIEALFGQADVLLFSGDYARHHGYDGPAALLRGVSHLHAGADLYCTWGAAGAASMDRTGAEYSQSALVSGPVVDTLGAGDVFNAGVIAGYLDGRDMPGILRQACALAGRKCTQTGFAGLTAAD